MPAVRVKDKLPIEIVVGNDERHHMSVRKPRSHASPSGFNSERNVGAGGSCHPTDANHHRSSHVPFHPVWSTPVARFPVPIRSGDHMDYFRIGDNRRESSDPAKCVLET